MMISTLNDSTVLMAGGKMVPLYTRRDEWPLGEFGQKEYHAIRRIV